VHERTEESPAGGEKTEENRFYEDYETPRESVG
jgi:hypothetical protein